MSTRQNIRSWFTISSTLMIVAGIACSTPNKTPTDTPSNAPSSTPTSTPSQSNSPSNGPSSPPPQLCGVDCQCGIDLNWQAPVGGSDPVADYLVYQQLNGSTFTELDPSLQPGYATTDAIPDIGVGNYCYYVTSQDAKGNQSGPSNTICIPVSTCPVGATPMAQKAGARATVRNVGSVSLGQAQPLWSKSEVSCYTRGDSVSIILAEIAQSNPTVKKIAEDPTKPKFVVTQLTLNGKSISSTLDKACEGASYHCDVQFSDLISAAGGNGTYHIEYLCLNHPEYGPQIIEMNNPSPDAFATVNCSK